ncbi:hypothetical protein VPH35_123810 [Triticum aestivum]
MLHEALSRHQWRPTLRHLRSLPSRTIPSSCCSRCPSHPLRPTLPRLAPSSAPFHPPPRAAIATSRGLPRHPFNRPVPAVAQHHFCYFYEHVALVGPNASVPNSSSTPELTWTPSTTMIREYPSCAKFLFDQRTTTGALLKSDYNVNNYRLRRTVPRPSSTFSEDFAKYHDMTTLERVKYHYHQVPLSKTKFLYNMCTTTAAVIFDKTS